MLTRLKKKNEGFTIIEVMIVLAIAGLIMLIVFLAVPALQRNARNTQRKNDVASLISAFNEYVNNNNGQVPTTSALFTSNIITSGNWKPGYYTAASAVTYAYNATAPGSVPTPTGATATEKIDVTSYATCNGTAGTPATNARSVAVTFNVETSSGAQAQCETAQ